LELPYLELRLKTKNEAGDLVDLTTLAYVRFIWISDEVNCDQYLKREMEDRIVNKPGSTTWQWSSESTAEPEWGAIQAQVMAEKGGQMNERLDMPYGARTFRVPILPSDYKEEYPRRAKAMDAAGMGLRHLLRCGEWYRARVFLKYEDLPRQLHVVPEPRREGEYFSAYFQVPDAKQVKPGEIASVDLLVLPRMRPPFHPTQGFSAERIAKGEHVKPICKPIKVHLDRELDLSRLELWHIHNVRTAGYYQVHKVAGGETVRLQVFDTAPGGITLVRRTIFGRGRDVILTVREIDFEADAVYLPEAADYATSESVSFEVDLSQYAQAQGLDRYRAHLAIGLKDAAPIAMVLTDDSGPTQFKSNPGTYYVQMHHNDGPYDIPGKVVVAANSGGRTVSLVPLSEAEQKEWEEFKPKSLKIRRQVADDRGPQSE
jgi:hypothetical protein